MRLFFRPGDSLAVTPVPLDQVRVGDVVVFRSSNTLDGDNWTVHRVIVHHGDRLVTQGDNNPQPDIMLVNTANLLGVVHSYERNGRTKQVRGGRGGLLYSQLMRELRWLVRFVMGVGRHPYRWLRRSGLVRHLWRPNLVRMQIQTEQGILVKYIHRQRTVAIWHPQRRTFSVQKPYDLVIPPREKDHRS